MPPENSSSPARPSRWSSKRKLSRGTVGALMGAAVGSVLGTVLARKVHRANMRKLVPNRVPALGKRALAAAKNVASNALLVAKATAAKSRDQALSEAKSAAQHFVIDTATGQPPTPPASPRATSKTSRKKSRRRATTTRRATSSRNVRRAKSRR